MLAWTREMESISSSVPVGLFLCSWVAVGTGPPSMSAVCAKPDAETARAAMSRNLLWDMQGSPEVKRLRNRGIGSAACADRDDAEARMLLILRKWGLRGTE